MDIPVAVQELILEGRGPTKYPYTAVEVLLASVQPADLYHRHLMAWAGARIQELEEKISVLEGKK